ncbi:preprotein translocase subunit YajC [soil metagenome]
MTLATFLFLAQAAPAAGANNSPLGMIVPMIFIFIIFYFLMIRPQQKKQKEHEKLVNAVKTGDEIITNGGIHGIVSNVKDKSVMVKVADNVKIEFERSAIVSVTRAPENGEASK